MEEIFFYLSQDIHYNFFRGIFPALQNETLTETIQMSNAVL
jgi:hypothetical protein